MKRAGFLYVTLGAAQRGISLLLLPFVTRAMAIQEYGAVSVLVAIGALASAAFGAPVQTAVVRWTARDTQTQAQRDAVAASRVWLLLISPLFLTIIAAIVSAISGSLFAVPGYQIGIELVAVGLALHLNYFTLPHLRATELLKTYVWLSVAAIIIGLAGKVLFVIVLRGGVLGWVISDLLAAIAGLVLSTIVSKRSSLRVRVSGIRSLTSFAAPLSLQTVATWATQSLSRPMLTVLLPLSLIGLYSAAINALSAALVLIFEFNKSAVVYYARVERGNIAELGSITRFQRWLAACVTMAVFAASPLFVAIILPPEYSSANVVLGIAGASVILLGLYDLPMNILLYSLGISRRSWLPTVAATLCLVGTTFLLTPIFGVAGAAMGTILSYAVMMGVAFVICRAYRVKFKWSHHGMGWLDISLLLLAIVPCAIATALVPGSLTWLLCLLIGTVALSIMYSVDRRARVAGNSESGEGSGGL